MILTMNEWTVSGRVFYLKELDGEYAASIKIKGEARRDDGAYSSQILEFGCLMKHSLYEEAKKKKIGLKKFVTLSGHLETWKRTINGKPCDKVMFVADYILDVI